MLRSGEEKPGISARRGNFVLSVGKTTLPFPFVYIFHFPFVTPEAELWDLILAETYLASCLKLKQSFSLSLSLVAIIREKDKRRALLFLLWRIEGRISSMIRPFRFFSKNDVFVRATKRSNIKRQLKDRFEEMVSLFSRLVNENGGSDD